MEDSKRMAAEFSYLVRRLSARVASRTCPSKFVSAHYMKLSHPPVDLRPISVKILGAIRYRRQ
jgi:hypothetical protein